MPLRASQAAIAPQGDNYRRADTTSLDSDLASLLLCPPLRFVLDVPAKVIKLVLVTDNSVVDAPLSKHVASLAMMPINRNRRQRLERPQDSSQGWVAPVRTADADHQRQDPVDVVGHDHEGVKVQTRETLRELGQGLADDRFDRRLSDRSDGTHSYHARRALLGVGLTTLLRKIEAGK